MKSTSKYQDKFVSRFGVALDACTARRRDIISLHNWVKGTGNINQEEASFLRDEEDLMSISSRPDEAQSYFETCVVRAGVKFSRILHKVGALTWSRKETCMYIRFSIDAPTNKASIADHPPKNYPETHEFTSPKDRSFGV
jgi:hypothetical protein